jgi:nitrite reductase/ring-hydroxylating ferredoxin subunit
MADRRVAPGEVICRSEELSDGGTGIRFSAVRDATADPAFVVRFRGRAYGWRNRCAHRQVELDWLPGRLFDASGRWLICALHGAHYDPANGICTAGPCVGGRLEPVAVQESEGLIRRGAISDPEP